MKAKALASGRGDICPHFFRNQRLVPVLAHEVSAVWWVCDDEVDGFLLAELAVAFRSRHKSNTHPCQFGDDTRSEGGGQKELRLIVLHLLTNLQGRSAMNEVNIEKLRENFPIVKRAVYMNHGAISPCTRYVRDAIHKHVENWTNMDPEFMSLVPFGGEGPGQGYTSDVKEAFARLIRCKPGEIALVPNTNHWSEYDCPCPSHSERQKCGYG